MPRQSIGYWKPAVDVSTVGGEFRLPMFANSPQRCTASAFYLAAERVDLATCGRLGIELFLVDQNMTDLSICIVE